MTSRITGRTVLSVAFATGAIALFTQAALFRELSIILHSNDLIVGILLSSWLLLAGLGSILSPFGNRWFRSFATQAIIACVSVIWLHLIANLLTPGFGQIWPFYKTVFLIFVTVAPSAISTGAVFSSLSMAFRVIGDPARVYIYEGGGSLLGGLLSLLLVAILPTQVSLSIITGAAFGGVLIFTAGGKKALASGTAFLLIFISIPLFMNIESKLTEDYYSGYSVERYESVHGAIQVLGRYDETYIYQSGVYLGSTSDTNQSAPLIHTLLANTKPGGNFLLIGGVLQGNVSSILKHNPEKITVIMHDPKLLEIGAANFPAFRGLNDGRVEVIIGDPVRKIKSLDRSYDYILLFPGIPQSSQTGRLLTRRVFYNLGEILDDSGKIIVGFPTAPNIVTDEEAALMASIEEAMSEFGPVTAYFGESTALLALPDSGGIGKEIRSLPPEKVRKLHLPYEMILDLFEDYRQKDLRDRIAEADIQANTWSKPVVLLLGLRRWEELAGGGILALLSSIPYVIWLSIILVLLIIALIMSLSVKAPGVMITALSLFTGAFGMGSSIWLMYYFQVVGGQLYLAIGMLSALFLVGTITGARLSTSGILDLGKWRMQFLAVVIVLLILDLSALTELPIWLAIFIFGLYHLVAGGIVGALFPLLLYQTDRYNVFSNRAPAVIYGSDLIGSAISAPMFGVLLIPVFGMTGAYILLVADFALIMAISIFSKNK